MLFSHLELPITYLPFSSTLNTFRSRPSILMVEHTQTWPKLSINLTPYPLKSHSPFPCFSVNGRDLFGAFYRSVSLGENSMRCQAKCNTAGLSEEKCPSLDLPEDDCEDVKEVQRGMKIEHGNKGKVPWNKGRKHSAETLERIRLRTKEALSDPKVRKKMSECPRSLSKQTKMRIRSALMKLWGERLNWKRSREKVLQSWAESIAEAAKRGGEDQEELEWDSYDKIMRELSLQQIQLAAEKAKAAKELARLRAERAAQAKVEKMARLAEREKEREEREKLRGEIKRRRRRSKQELEELVITEELKLKARLMKIQKKKSVVSHVSPQQPRAWEKLDVELIHRENIKREVSFEDQILLAKKKRSESLNEEDLTVLPSHSVKTSPRVK